MSGMNDLLINALRIRLIEEKIIEIYDTDAIQSPVHLSIGQESVAVGLCSGLGKNDKVYINYRGHGIYLAKGGCLKKFFCELMGKRNGISGGKAGSMHLSCKEENVMGASAIVASTIPHAVGGALASKIRKDEETCYVAHFGDGATEQGVFYESMNFASLKNLRVIFFCEDNGLAVHAKKNERQAYDLKKLTGSYGIKYMMKREGSDPYAVQKIVRRARRECVKSNRPVFLHVKTSRYKEHVGPNEDLNHGYRNINDIKKWKDKDPLLKKTLLLLSSIFIY